MNNLSYEFQLIISILIKIIMLSDTEPANWLQLFCADSCWGHSARVAPMNPVSEPSPLNEGDLPQFCDRNSSVPPILCPSDLDFPEETGLITLCQTQLVDQTPHPPAQNFLF